MQLRQNYDNGRYELPTLYIKVNDNRISFKDNTSITAILTNDLIPKDWIKEIEALHQQEKELKIKRRHLVKEYETKLNELYPNFDVYTYLKKNYPELLV